MEIRAKVVIGSAIKNEYGEQINAYGVHSGSTNAEDNTFSAATPSLHLSMSVTNPEAIGKLEQGKKYYLTFTEAPE
jgi:thiamine monophosphate synthase